MLEGKKNTLSFSHSICLIWWEIEIEHAEKKKLTKEYQFPQNRPIIVVLTLKVNGHKSYRLLTHCF